MFCYCGCLLVVGKKLIFLRREVILFGEFVKDGNCFCVKVSVKGVCLVFMIFL